MNIIEQLDAEEMARIEGERKLPEFSPGDTLRVLVRVTEGTRTRVQAYEGVCIARAGGGINESFTVRKISYGEGVERVFPIFSPMLEGVEIIRRGKVRRAKLYTCVSVAVNPHVSLKLPTYAQSVLTKKLALLLLKQKLQKLLLKLLKLKVLQSNIYSTTCLVLKNPAEKSAGFLHFRDILH